MLKGANCKNVALQWIRENAKDGVLYFADDDNSYDVDLFEEVSASSLLGEKWVSYAGNLFLPLILRSPYISRSIFHFVIFTFYTFFR